MQLFVAQHILPEPIIPSTEALSFPLGQRSAPVSHSRADSLRPYGVRAGLESTQQAHSMSLMQPRCENSAIIGKCRDSREIEFRQGDVALGCHVELTLNLVGGAY